MAARTLVVAGVLVRGARVLAARRRYPPALAGKWEFPGGKAEPGESPEAALARELLEELGVRVIVGEELPGPQNGVWPINDALDMRAYWCRGEVTASHGIAHDRLAWVPWQDVPSLDWLPADIILAALVADRVRVGL